MSNPTSYKTIKEIEEHCVSAISRLGKWITDEKDRCQKCYYIGQETAFKEILLGIHGFDPSETNIKENKE